MKTRLQTHLDLYVSNRMRAPASLVRFLRAKFIAAHRLLNPPLAEVSLALVDDAVMVSLHNRYFALRSRTDVLTFELDHDARGRISAGEIVVCVPQAQRMADIRRRPLRNEVLLYALHGMLHLCGFDDRTPIDFAAIHEMEDSLLTRLGIGPVFQTDHRAPQKAGQRAVATPPARPSRR